VYGGNSACENSCQIATYRKGKAMFKNRISPESGRVASLDGADTRSAGSNFSNESQISHRVHERVRGEQYQHSRIAPCMLHRYLCSPSIQYLIAGIVFAFIIPFTLKAAALMPQDGWYYDGSTHLGNYSNLELGPDGYIYGNKSGGIIDVFDEDLKLIRSFPVAGGFNRGLAIDSNTNVYVFSGITIKKYSSIGSLLTEWGESGVEDGQFTGAYQDFGWNTMAIGNGDAIYAIDVLNDRVQVFDTDGNFIRKWGSTGELPGQFQKPQCIGISTAGDVFVFSGETLYSTQALQKFNSQGEYIAGLFRKERDHGAKVYMRNFSITYDGLIIYGNDSSTGTPIRVLDLSLRELGTFDLYGAIGDGYLGLPYYTPPNGVTGTRLFGGRWVALTVGRSGKLFYGSDGTFTNAIYALDRKYDYFNKATYSKPPVPSIEGVLLRVGSNLVDIDYGVVDVDSPTLTTGILAFVDGLDSLSSVLRMDLFAENTRTNLGTNVAANISHRVTWDASEVAVGFANYEFEILANDGRGLLDFHFTTVPAQNPAPVFQLTRQAVTDNDMLSVWYWLIAVNDPAISFTNGVVKGNGGAFDTKTLASGTSTTADGRSFLYQRMNVRAPTADEITRAKSGNFNFPDPGGINSSYAVKITP